MSPEARGGPALYEPVAGVSWRWCLLCPWFNRATRLALEEHWLTVHAAPLIRHRPHLTVMPVEQYESVSV